MAKFLTDVLNFVLYPTKDDEAEEIFAFSPPTTPTRLLDSPEEDNTERSPNLPAITTIYCNNFLDLLTHLEQYVISHNQMAERVGLENMTLHGAIYLFSNMLQPSYIVDHLNPISIAFNNFAMLNSKFRVNAEDYLISRHYVEAGNVNQAQKELLRANYRYFKQELVSREMMPSLFINIANSIIDFVKPIPPEQSVFNSYYTFRHKNHLNWEWALNNLGYLDFIKTEKIHDLKHDIIKPIVKITKSKALARVKKMSLSFRDREEKTMYSSRSMNFAERVQDNDGVTIAK